MILLFAVSGMSARYAFGRGNGQYGKCSETGTVRNYDSKRYWSAVVYRFGIYGLGFFLGYFIFSHDEVMERLEKCWLLLLVCALVLAIAFTVIYWGKPYAEHSVLDTPLCNVFAWITVLAVLAVMKKWGDFSNAFTDWMGKKSWGLYLFHYLFIAMASYYLTMYVKNLPVPMVYLCVAVAGFAGSYLAHAIISHIPVLRWLICGMGGKKKDVCR